MTLTGFLDQLPGIASEVGIYRVDSTGMVLSHSGKSDGAEFRIKGTKVETVISADRQAFTWQSPIDDEWLVVTYQTQRIDDDDFTDFLTALFTMLSEKSQLERDMESMYASSLALLEEVSMVGDVMPKLSSGESEEATVMMGLDALMVASSVHRAIYARFHRRLGQCEMLVHLVMDPESRKTVPVALPEEVWFDANIGLVGRAIDGSGSAIMESVPAKGRLGAVGFPEWHAKKEIVATPVCYGDGEDQEVLGVICIMDKQATAYSNVTSLGSQESKMATVISSMLGSVLGTRKAAEFRKEVHMAAEIQQQILPEGPAELAGYDMAGCCLASGLVGGDYFDFLPMKNGRILAMVADVSGHNMASGMLMVSARATIRSLASMHIGAAKIFALLGDSLFQDLHKTERFITATGVALRENESKIELVNAGHNDTLIYRKATGVVDRIESGGPIFGFLDGFKYSSTKRILEPGDVLILYTDGITEATDSAGVMYEEERLAEALKVASNFSAQGILESILLDLQSYVDKTDEGDDVTLVVIRRTEDDGGTA